MQVLKRNGQLEEMKLDKLTNRVKFLSKNLKIDPTEVSKRCAVGLFDKISTKEIDDLLASTASNLIISHPDYGRVAGRILASRLQKETPRFYEAMKILGKKYYIKSKKKDPTVVQILNDDYMKLVKKYGKELEEYIDYKRDFQFNYFGVRTQHLKYLLSIKKSFLTGDASDSKTKVIIERPQDLYMRIALSLHKDDIEKVKRLYDKLSLSLASFGTPTQTQSGTIRPQLSSCFLISMESDSIDGIYSTLKDVALISQSAGGVGLSVSNVRARGSLINSTQCEGSGIIPMLKPFDNTSAYVDQGGKRQGAFSVYLEPWHADVEDLLESKNPNTIPKRRLENLFIALWVNDLFMERVEADKEWSLFSPSDCPDLQDLYGEEFSKAYEGYEDQGVAVKTINARDLWTKIIETCYISGVPYIGFKDSANKKSNQKNLGTIRSSNLCIEIMQYSSKEEIAVCNLASIVLQNCMKENQMDYKLLGEVTEDLIEALDLVIDTTMYPVEKARKSNLRHRPVGLGVQGLADVFMKMGVPFASHSARETNKNIFETMYYHAIKKSVALAKSKGKYDSFDGSPASEGLLQFDLWGVSPSDRYDWEGLKQEVVKHGLRNSLLIALMPTATTAQIIGSTESMEPMTSNLYSREINGGNFVVVNEYLVKDLEKIGLWTSEIKEKIQRGKGSIADISEIPDDIKEVYKTVWEMKMKDLMEMSADRAPYVCQSQSMNVYMSEPNVGRLSSALMASWKLGLKTGSYYIKQPQDGGMSMIQKETDNKASVEAVTCSLDNREGCDSCGA